MSAMQLLDDSTGQDEVSTGFLPQVDGVISGVNTGLGLTREGMQAPTDSITLGQLKNMVAAIPKQKQTLYTFPTPTPDSADLPAELEEFYSYVEVAQVLEHRDTFLQTWTHSTEFNATPKETQMEFVKGLIADLSSTSVDVRFSAERRLVHISQGAFTVESTVDQETHFGRIKVNGQLLREAGILQPAWAVLNNITARWEEISLLPPDSAGRESPDVIFLQKEKQAILDELNSELSLLLAILYFVAEVHRGDPLWGEELFTLEPPIPVYLLNVVAGLRERNAKGYPVKKLLLLLWKSLLCCLGGFSDVNRVKRLVREIESLPPDPETEKNFKPHLITKVTPQSLLAFKNEIASKYPTFTPDGLPTQYPQVELERLSAASAPYPVTTTFSYHANPNHSESYGTFEQHPPTPAPSPPPQMQHPITGGLMKPKKFQFQTDQTRPFILPFSPANAGRAGTRPKLVPTSIEEAAELFQQNSRISTELWQTWKLREEFMNDERGILKMEMLEAQAKRSAEDHAKQEEETPLTLLVKLRKRIEIQMEQAPDEQMKNQLQIRIQDIQRLERIEIIYRSCLPQLQSAVIVLLKLLLATVTANNTLNQNGESEPPANVSLEDIDILRHREITSKAVSAILILVLKWFKVSHSMKFNYFAQLLVDSNCLLLILKMFGLQEVSTSVKAKNEQLKFNFFKFCKRSLSSEDEEDELEPDTEKELDTSFEQPAEEVKAEDILPDNPDKVELIDDYSWRNFFTVINFVHILQKLTKRRIHRILLLVQYKSSAIMKRILKVSQPTLQLYVLKVIKSQVPYCGRKWRQSNMKVITAIYLHCRPDLRDEWLTKVDVDNDAEDSLPQEHALRALVRFFNTRYYREFAPQIHQRTGSNENEHGNQISSSPGSQGGENEFFPPSRSVASFDPEQSGIAPPTSFTYADTWDHFDWGHNEDLLLPHEKETEDDFDTLSETQLVWDRMGSIMGEWDDISDSESIGSIHLYGLSGVSSDAVFDDDELDITQNRHGWEAISAETITALEEEKKAINASPRSPRPRGRRPSTGPISPALRPVLIELDQEDSPVGCIDEGPAPTEPHMGNPVDEVELVFGR